MPKKTVDKITPAAEEPYNQLSESDFWKLVLQMGANMLESAAYRQGLTVMSESAQKIIEGKCPPKS